MLIHRADIELLYWIRHSVSERQDCVIENRAIKDKDEESRLLYNNAKIAKTTFELTPDETLVNFGYWIDD